MKLVSAGGTFVSLIPIAKSVPRSSFDSSHFYYILYLRLTVLRPVVILIMFYYCSTTERSLSQQYCS